MNGLGRYEEARGAAIKATEGTPELFVAMWALGELRARRELIATGQKLRMLTAETRDDLTPKERQIARLARDGLRIRRSAHSCS